MIRNLAYYGNPILRKKARNVEQFDEKLESLIEDMFDTMAAYKGIGLAAPQVGLDLRIFVTCVPLPPAVEEGEWLEGIRRVFINPTLSDLSVDLWDYEEGCLSIPKLCGTVARPFEVTCEAQDVKGNVHKGTYSALEARCIMHENDHINGVLFIDRVKGKERKDLEPSLERLKKELGKEQSENLNPELNGFRQ